MRRFVTLVFLLLFTIPFGISISGCSKKATVVYCNGQDSGPVVGQLYFITLQPKLYGISLNQGQQGQVSAPAATDCKTNSVSAPSYTYGTFLPNGQADITIADVQPTTGKLCAGTWNRNSGGGVADFTTCIPTGKSGTVFVTASSGTVTSNPIAIYVHPVVTSVVLGSPSTDCTNDPATNCSVDLTTNQCTLSTVTGTTAPAYTGNSCLSQGDTGQLAARVYSGAGATRQNISCLAGHLTYTPQDSTIVSIDQNGVATAAAPGATLINSSLSQAGSSAGFFATCPPASITLTPANSTSTAPITVNQNFAQSLTATVTDTKGKVVTGVNLAYVSTTPTTLPTSSTSTITPTYPGAGSIVAVCQPPSCNGAPINQIGLFGNGKPIVSNKLLVTTPGINSSLLYIASTQSRYLVPVDFTSTTLGAPVQLPYVPNSIAISNDNSTIYMGSTTELMVFNATTNAVTKEDTTVPGKVIAISPDSATIVISDPTRQIISLYSSSGAISTTYGGVASHAEFSPDSTTVYITAGTQLLIHSTLTGWTAISGSSVPALTTPVSDVAVTVPSQGAFFSGATTTARGICSATTVGSTNGLLSTTNVLYPDAGVTAPATDRIVATDDGQHVIGVTATTAAPTLTDLKVVSLNAAASSSSTGNQGQCPTADGTALQFTTTASTAVLPGVSASSITGVFASSDSASVFVTYAGTGGVLPLYLPTTNGLGTLSNVALGAFGGTAPVAPVSGAFSSDNTTFYAGTSGDNRVHIVTKGPNGFADTTTPIAPKLTDASGNIVVPDLIVQRPRKPL